MTEFKRRILAAFVIGFLVSAITSLLVIHRDNRVHNAFAKVEDGTVDEYSRSWPLFERIDQAVFDNLFSIAAPKWTGSVDKGSSTTGVVGVVIDTVTMQNFADEPSFGRWPWSRAAWEEILAFIAEGQPKAIIFDIIFAEPMRTKGVQEGIQEWPPGSGNILRVADITFAYAITGAERVYLPYRLPSYSARKVEDRDVKLLNVADPVFSSQSSKVSTSSMRNVVFATEQVNSSLSGATVRNGRVCDAPFTAIAERCYGFGWADAEVDPDGSLRRSALVASHPLKEGFFFPTLSVAAVMNGERGLLSIDKAGNLYHKGVLIPSDRRGHHLIRWEGRQDNRFSCYSAGRVVLSYRHSLGEMDERLPEDLRLEPGVFKDKYVVIGTTMAAGHDAKRTPFGGDEPGMVKHLTLLQNLLDGAFMERASTRVVLFIVALFSLLLSFAFLFIGSAQKALGILLASLGGYAILVSQLFVHSNYQLDVTAPIGAIFATFAMTLSWNYFVEDKQKRAVRKMFDKYMSPELVAEMMNNPELVKPGGRRRQLTAFFSDLANFTTLSESLEPEELVVLINEYLEIMTREIVGNGGYLDKYQGDGIMAVFGVYSEEAEHALEACRAALANQRDIIDLSNRWVSEGRTDVHVRIGINSGPMIAGNVGSEAKMNYTVLGDAVNLAARLESANKQFGTLIMLGEATYELVKDHVISRELDLLAVKGKKKGVKVYELIGMADEYVLSNDQSEMLAAYSDGLALYRKQEFLDAVESFKKGLHAVPGDGPCEAYIDRCIMFSKNPPGEDWDGVYRLTTK